jgi:CheY-like chemotaxis protein
MAHDTRPPSEPSHAPRDSERAPAATRLWRVLVVDDDAPIGAVIRRMLGAAYSVEFVVDARLALARIAEGARFDVILSDVMMPEMSGVDFHSALADLAPDQYARVIFMTGDTTNVNYRRYLDAVPNPLVEKPFDIQRIRALVRETASR